MRILADLLFMTGRKGGMESYVRQLYPALADSGHEFVGLASRELAATDTSWFPGRMLASGISGDDRIAWARGELFSVSRWARRENVDVVHCPANFAPLRSSVPVVVTVHDLLPFRHPEYVPGPYSAVLRGMIRAGVRTSRRVITDSEATKSDIERYLATPAHRIDAIPLAGPVPSDVAPAPREPNTLLAVGNRMPHKNYAVLFEALASVPVEKRPRLRIPGSSPTDPLIAEVARWGVGDHVELLPWIDEATMERLYSTTALVVFPTLFEGFGLPTLEAMARGCPVACSDIPVLREIAGDAAEYFDPRSASDVGATLTSLVADPHRLADLSRRGLERARHFDWTRTAAATLESFVRAMRTDF